MLTGREGQCFNARAYLLLFFKNLMNPAFDFIWLCRVELNVNCVVYVH